MKDNYWYAVKQYRESKVVHLVNADSFSEVTSYAKTLFHKPVIVELTYWMLRELIGCIIPDGKEPIDLCRDVLIFPRRCGYHIQIKAL